MCTCIVHWQCANNTKQHCPIGQGAWQKEKRKICATRIFSGHPLGRDTSPTYVCALVLYIGNAQTTQKQQCPIDQGARQKEKTKIRATRIFSDHPLGRDSSPTYVCALVLFIGNAQATQKQHCSIDLGAWQKEKKSARRGFSQATHWVVTQVLRTCVQLYCTLTKRKQHKNNIAPLTRELGKRKKKSARRGFSPTTHSVVTQVLRTCVQLYCTLAIGKQHKNNIAPLTRELGKRKKEKSARRGFSPATHWVVTQVLRTFVHLFCILAMRKQHKNNNAPLTRELGKRKKQKSAQRGFSPTTHWVVTQVLRTCVHLYCTLAIGKQHKNNIAPLTRELGKRKKKNPRDADFLGPPTGS